MRFFKNGHNGGGGGDGKFLLEIGESQKWWGWFYLGGDGNWQRGANPLFYEEPAIPLLH